MHGRNSILLLALLTILHILALIASETLPLSSSMTAILIPHAHCRPASDAVGARVRHTNGDNVLIYLSAEWLVTSVCQTLEQLLNSMRQITHLQSQSQLISLPRPCLSQLYLEGSLTT